MSDQINDLITSVKALELVADIQIKQIIDLQSQHNVVVDNITDLQGRVNQLETAANGVLWPEGQPPVRAAYNLGRQPPAAQPAPPAAPDRLRQCPTHGQQPSNAWGCPECVRELRAALAAQPRQKEEAAPSPIIDALIKAECALADVVEGESDANSPIEALKWAEQRCTATLAIIRPVMRQHGITTSEWPPAAEPTPPPAPAGGLVERVAEEIYDFTGDHVEDNEASAVIRAVADWLDTRGNRGSAAELRQEVNR
jgi:hypothetical protein